MFATNPVRCRHIRTIRIAVWLFLLLIQPTFVMAQATSGGQVRIDNKTKELLTIKIVDYYVDETGKNREEGYVWKCEAPGPTHQTLRELLAPGLI